MKISELAQRTGVPLATVKLYQREGLLMPGAAINKTQSQYGPEHVGRVNLIRSLSALPGYSYQLLRQLFGLIADDDRPVSERVSEAMRVLPGGRNAEGATEHASPALDLLDVTLEEGSIIMPQLESALAAVEAVGMPCSPERLLAYWTHVRSIAELEVSGMEEFTDDQEAVAYAIVGTAMYEPVILALRRLAHQRLFEQETAANS